MVRFSEIQQFPDFLELFLGNFRTICPRFKNFGMFGRMESALCYRKNPVKCSACVVSQTIAIEWKIALSEMRLFLENHSLEFHEIWHENTRGNK